LFFCASSKPPAWAASNFYIYSNVYTDAILKCAEQCNNRMYIIDNFKNLW